MKNISKYKVQLTSTVKDAIRQLDRGGLGFCAVVNGNDEVIGIITDGDFRRSVLGGIDLTANVMQIANRDFKYLPADYSMQDAKNVFSRESNIEYLPILDHNKLVDLIAEKDLTSNVDISTRIKKLDTTVIIMAGGRGTRLDPFTKILPKALIPIGDKSIIELIIDKYLEYSINEFLISINHKAKMIKAYFEELNDDYTIGFIEEDKYLGTAGALSKIGVKFKNPFFVSNCDIIINDNYAQIYDFHRTNSFDLTIVASMHYQTVPYGVCEIDDGGILHRIIEKPETNYLVNTGMYILNPDIPEFIPHDTFFNMTDLIEVIQKNNGKVGVYPVTEKSWIDIGQWEEYKTALNILNKD